MERDTVISCIRKLLALGHDGANAEEATSGWTRRGALTQARRCA